jgi:hypothetical protein
MGLKRSSAGMLLFDSLQSGVNVRLRDVNPDDLCLLREHEVLDQTVEDHTSDLTLDLGRRLSIGSYILEQLEPHTLIELLFRNPLTVDLRHEFDARWSCIA